MKYYYEAYNQRYMIIHEKGHSWSSDIPTPIVSDVIQKHSISKNASILEIGCGEGRDAFPLLENGYDVLATDISSEAINYCKYLRPDYSIHFSILDCINDHHGQHYDFIYSVAVIHMLVSDEDRIRFYHFIYDHLLDGRLALFLLNISGKNIHFGVTAILCVLLERQILILLENILRAKVDGIHPID